MRYLLISTAILAAAPALADRIETTARVTDVTVYPWGAGVTREASLDLPAGAHELVITGIPSGIDPATLRVSGEGATIGAISVQRERALPGTPEKSPELRAAEDALRDQRARLAQFDTRVEEIEARAQAASDMIDFLMRLAGSETMGGGDFSALAGSVGQQLLEARQTMVQAAAEAETAREGRDEIEEDLARAEARLAALRGPDSDRIALLVAVQGQDDQATLRITSLTDNARWEPVYDLSLQRKAGTLRMERGLMVQQDTGEDWQDVRLTLSTARPMDQSAPSTLSTDFLRIEDPQARERDASGAMAADAAIESLFSKVAASRVDPVVELEPIMPEILGETVVYGYPTPVDMRDGADALRLPLDAHDLTPEIVAEAVPRHDDTAYLVADTVNSTGAVILPGDATFYADGAMVGRGALELTAAGDEMKLGFGPLTGIKVERRIPDETEGGRGLLVKSSERMETAILAIRNLTGEEWPLRVIDRVPISTQEDLRIEWSAEPGPDETDPDGKRGLLVWNGPIAAGEDREIRVTTRIRWPEGQVLIGR
ncbi:conserved hypothetical protein [Paracoccus halophilus]|uniref:Mucoidy inhibitor MuiA family protein n=1 Tax=Paracoccus halophilus TaxID=376733 RepID=A0A099F5X5_9RHOB|nr:DUF4139 domain-containing protein [Paracoccus halophilus]KGJ05673.1 hypothetical protein IT41_05565 [Paracoccus halophilus]SFA47839.1 conserved hypothetical protein [Paracoccus halophilus]